MDDQGFQEEIEDGKRIYCANCQHCKLVRIEDAVRGGGYHLRVRCGLGQWKKKLGEEKLYKYFTVARRYQEECEHYTPMGDLRPFLKDLKHDLPLKDELYTD